MLHALQDTGPPARHDGRRNDEFNDWIEPLGSSADEMQKAQFEICSWLNQVSVSTGERIGADSPRA